MSSKEFLRLAMTSTSTERAGFTRLAILLGLSAAVAVVSGLVTVKSVNTWYVTLAKPAFNPPNWLFGPVWTVLYIAMAIAAWRIWSSRNHSHVGVAMGLYAAQMTLNFAWSLIFFGMHHIGAGLVDLLGLVGLLTAATFVFWRRDAVSGALMALYLAWASFAALLNFSIWRLN